MPPKRKRASPADEVGAVSNGAGKGEGAEQLPAAVAAVEPANKKARAEETRVPPGPPPPSSEQPEWGSDEGAEWCPLDAQAAVCEWVDSTADLVRLSCVNRTWHQLVARDGLWRRRFLAERGQAAHDALALALDLHGHAALSSFLAQARRPPARAATTTIARMEQEAAVDDDDGETKSAASGVETETEEGGHGFGVWFEALIVTDKKMWWRRWLATLERLEPAQGMPWMTRLVRAAEHRADLERRVVEWLDADGKGRNQGADDDDDDGKKSDSDDDCDDDDDDDGSKAYDQDTGRLKAPQLKNELQKKQVRALLHMTRIVDHLSSSCSDDYRGNHAASKRNVLVQFLDNCCLYSRASQGSDSQYSVDTCKNWAYAANTARDDNPDVRPRHLPEFFDRLRLDLLHPNQEENEKEENLSLEQFLYFVGLALDLGDTDEYERGYTPLQALIAQGTVARGTQSSHGDNEEL